MPSGEKKVQGYVSEQLYASIELYAKHHGISVSKAVGELLIQGLISFNPGDSVEPLKRPQVSISHQSPVSYSKSDEPSAVTNLLIKRLKTTEENLNALGSIVAIHEAYMREAFIEFFMLHGLTENQALEKIESLLQKGVGRLRSQLPP